MSPDRTTPTGWAADLCAVLLDNVSPDTPGFGGDVYREGDFHYPDAYSLFLKAAVRTGREDIAAGAAGWLIANSALNEAGAPGWGLPFAHRTFGETPNPPHTIYAITNAMVVSGLMDWFEASRDARALAVVQAALDHYGQFCTGRNFFYSTFPSDNHVVPNVDGMLAGQYARCALLSEGERADRYRGLALGVRDNLLACMAPDGSWPYRVGKPKKNDVLHHAYVLYGLQEVATAFGPLAELDAARAFLRAYRQGSFLREMPRPPLSRRVMETLGLRHAEPARLWGVGAWLAACDPADAPPSAIAAVIARHRAADGSLWVSPLRKAASIRHNAHLAWGLARHV